MAGNLQIMENGEETILDMLTDIDSGHAVLDLEQACKDVVFDCNRLMKQGSVTFKLKFDPDPKTGAMRVSAAIDKKAPKEAPKASLFFVQNDNTLSRTDPRQKEMFKDDRLNNSNRVVHSD